MSEFCLNCWNQINQTNDPRIKYVFSDTPELCEGCGQLRPVIIAKRTYYYRTHLKNRLLQLIEKSSSK